jgi:hypothetical protein
VPRATTLSPPLAFETSRRARARLPASRAPTGQRPLLQPAPAADRRLGCGVAQVSEGSGQNLFVVRDGALYTPPINGSNLEGLTRSCVMQLARAAGIDVHVGPVPREALYVADELFFTGTATEVMPIRSLDKIEIGYGATAGARGPITELLQASYQGIVHGREEDVHGWMTWRD